MLTAASNFKSLPHHTHILKFPIQLWDVPSAGTPDIPVQSYVRQMGLHSFDAVMIVNGPRLSQSNIDLFVTLRGYQHPMPTYMLQIMMDRMTEGFNGIPQDICIEVADLLRKQLSRASANSADMNRIFLLACFGHFEDALAANVDSLFRLMCQDLQSVADLKLQSRQK